MEMEVEGDNAKLYFTPDERLVFLRKASYRLVDAATRLIDLDESGDEARVLGEALYAMPMHSPNATLLLEMDRVPFISRCLAYDNPAAPGRPDISEHLEAAAQTAATYLRVEYGVLQANLVIPRTIPKDFA